MLYDCDGCGASFSDTDVLDEHAQRCEAWCDDCDSTGWLPNDRPDLIEGDPPFQRCPECRERKGDLGEDERGLGWGGYLHEDTFDLAS